MKINGEKIRGLRQALGISQEAVCGTGKGRIGISVDTLSERERGIGDLNDTKVWQSLIFLAAFYKVSHESLVIRDEGEKPFHALDEMYSTLIMLDRLSQWDSLTKRCESDRHVVFFLNGTTEQYMELFLARVPFKLGDMGGGLRQQVFSLPMNDSGTKLSTGADWRSFFLRSAPSSSGTPEERLKKLTEEGPALLVAGAPYGLDGLRPGEKLGLGEFVRFELPQLLAKAKPKHPVRILLPAVDDSADPWIYKLYSEAETLALQRQREAASGKKSDWPELKFCKLSKLKWPSSDEIVDLVRDTLFVGGPEEFERLEPILRNNYEALRGGSNPDWRQIFLMIKRILRRGGEDEYA